MLGSPAVVITSINPPSEAVLKWSEQFATFVVGDTRTPVADYVDLPLTFLGQESEHLADTAPTNHYARKNIGYLAAISEGHTWILDTDDDTFPTGLVDPLGVLEQPRNRVRSVASDFINIFSVRSSTQFLWPRGLPLRAVHTGFDQELVASPSDSLAVIQFLIDGDTDVDAIQRLVFGSRDVSFDATSRLEVIDFGYFSPFNSQLTIFSELAFPLLYLPQTVSFRFTDILRSVVAKRVLDRLGHAVAFADPIGFQVRNAHDLTKDFIGEWSTYVETETSWAALAHLSSGSPAELLIESYERLGEAGIVENTELRAVTSWVSELETIQKRE